MRDGGQVGRAGPDLERLTFQVEPVPPFRLDLTVQALRRRAINAVDRWDGTTYRRILVVDGRPLEHRGRADRAARAADAAGRR